MSSKLFRGPVGDAGKICVVNAKGEAEFLAMSGAVTISVAGVTTVDSSIDTAGITAKAVTTAKIDDAAVTNNQLDPTLVQSVTVDIAAADVIAGNTTPVVLVADPGDGFALVFHGATVNIHAGTANYDQNQNYIVKYKDGSGVAVSTTLANFMNAGAAGKIGTLKAIATDHLTTASEALVLTSSASPKSAAGDRKLQVIVRYSVVPVVTA
jgi:hypothetical protein